MKVARLIFPLALALSAGTALVWSVDSIAASTPGAQERAPPYSPASAPQSEGEAAWLGAVGVVEPAGEITAIGAHRAGVVAAVAVAEGDFVERGQLLFELDARAADALVEQRSAALAAARALSDEVAARAGPLGALVAAAGAEVDAARAQLELVGSDGSAAPAGARWLAARAAVDEAEAGLRAARVERELLFVRAPFDGVVLAVDVRAGEYATTAERATPLVEMGRRELYVRAEFAEEDAPRFQPDAPAYASLRGAAGSRIGLRYVRTVPSFAPKRTLGGGAAERVDTRVLEVIYALPDGASGAAPGRRVDAFVADRSVDPR